jgi:O-antigen/teichoic acid export membrane protein
VGLGLVIAGVASYAFFIITKGALGDEAFKPVASLWFATFLLAPGFFLPLEQEVGRALAHRRALGQGGRPVVRRVLLLSIMLSGIVVVGVLAASPVITRVFFEGNAWMTVALVASFLAYAPAHMARGVCSGSGRFGAYAVVMGADGVTRVTICAVLAVVGVTVASAYGFVLAVAALSGVTIVAMRGALRTADGPPATWSEVTPNLGWLLGGTLLSAALVNAGPLTIDALAPSERAGDVTRFANAVLLARVPLFMFQAVQAALLPRLARLAARGDLAEFRAGFRRLMVVVLGVGTLGTAGSFVAGPAVYDVVFGGGIGRRTLTMLALGSACYMIAAATAQAVIALQGHWMVTAGWATGIGTFALVTAVAGDDLFQRVELGLAAGSAAAMTAFSFALRNRLAHHVPPDTDQLVLAVS